MLLLNILSEKKQKKELKSLDIHSYSIVNTQYLLYVWNPHALVSTNCIYDMPEIKGGK